MFCVHADDLCNYGGTCFSIPGSEVHQLYLWRPSLGDQRPPKQKLHRASQSSLRYCQLESGWSLSPFLLRQVPLCPAQPERDREASPSAPVSCPPKGFWGGSFKLLPPPPQKLNATSLRKLIPNRTEGLHPSKPFFFLSLVKYLHSDKADPLSLELWGYAICSSPSDCTRSSTMSHLD